MAALRLYIGRRGSLADSLQAGRSAKRRGWSGLGRLCWKTRPCNGA